MNMDVPDFYGLLVAPLVPVKGLDHVELRPKQLDGVATVNVDVDLIHVSLALAQEFLAGEAGGHDLDGEQGGKFGSGIDRGNHGDRSIERGLIKMIKGPWSQSGNELSEHDVCELVRERVSEGLPQSRPVRC
jgi:hypothetical protein